MSENVPVGSVVRYRVNLPAAIVFTVVYLALGILLVRTCLRARSKWGLVLGIGACCQGIGFALRIAFRFDQTSVGIYAVQQLVIVVSPACYFAFNYILFGRLTFNMARDHRVQASKSLTLLHPQNMGKLFITSDVVTFLLQMAGGGMQASENLTSVGDKIFLIGIVAQFASYIVFLLLVARLRLIVLPHLHQIPGVGPKIDTILLLLVWSSIWIVVRCVFRTVELAEGYEGALFNNETYFLVLDALPLVLAIGHYLPFWPSTFVNLDKDDNGSDKTLEDRESQEVILMQA